MAQDLDASPSVTNTDTGAKGGRHGKRKGNTAGEKGDGSDNHRRPTAKGDERRKGGGPVLWHLGEFAKGGNGHPKALAIAGGKGEGVGKDPPKGVDKGARYGKGYVFRRGRPPTGGLHEVVTGGDVQLVRDMLLGGAEVNKADAQGETALHCAARLGHCGMVRCLLDAGADPNLARNNGTTALHNAAGSGYVEVVQALLVAGANPSAANQWGGTVLHWAVTSDSREIVEALLHAGAEPLATDSEGKTARTTAENLGFHEVAELLGGVMEAVTAHGTDALLPRVLTVRGVSAGPASLELSCSTLTGNVAATLMWPSDAPLSGLTKAVIGAVRAAGFTGLKEPLREWNLRLLSHLAEAMPLDLRPSALPLAQQLGLPIGTET